MRKAASTIPQEGTPMQPRAFDAEAPTVSALAEPTLTTHVLFLGTIPRATTLTVPTTGIYDIVAWLAQGSQGIADRDAEIGGHFGVSAGEAPSIIIGANALMCGDAGIGGGVHVD
jgi:hypothetical protein